jgi:hypothetical protein
MTAPSGASRPGAMWSWRRSRCPSRTGRCTSWKRLGGLHLREARWQEGWVFVPWAEGYPTFPLEAVRVLGRVRGVVQYEPLT